jgi:excisionase family DNA binding protein
LTVAISLFIITVLHVVLSALLLKEFNGAYISAAEAARRLGITTSGIGRVIQSGRLPAVKAANRWFLARADLEAFAATYVGKPGRPRTKRKYTKRSPIWFKS